MEGIITKGVGGLYRVRAGQQEYPCRLRGKFRRTGSPLPGDRVRFEAGEPEGIIEEILARTNELVRPAIANVSQAYLVFSLVRPNLNEELLQRFLLVMEEKGIRPLILFNKRDLADQALLDHCEELLFGTGYEYLFISAYKDWPEELKSRLKGELTVLCGPSGAGKSTLLNALSGEVLMETGNLSEKIGRGKHTTRHTELMAIHGGLLADTPGFSSVAQPDLPPEELAHLFPEFRDSWGRCRFTGCLHHKEPGCDVKKRLGTEISPKRYDYYIKLLLHLKEEEKYQWD